MQNKYIYEYTYTHAVHTYVIHALHTLHTFIHTYIHTVSPRLTRLIGPEGSAQVEKPV
jgi:hypothetical protein